MKTGCVVLTKERKLLIVVNVALLCAQIGFGGFNVVGKYALEHIKPIVFAFYREVISGPLLLIIAAVVERVRPAKSDFWRLAILGLVLYGNQLCFIMGLKLTNSSTQTAIMQQCIPVFTSALTIMVKLEKFYVVKLVGILFAVLGAVVMIGFKGLSLNNRTVGMILLLGNAILISTYYVLQKPLLAKYPPITVTGWAYMVASVSMGLTSLMYVNDGPVYNIPIEVVWPLAYAVFVQTIFGYCCVSWANKHAPASLVAVYNSVQPIVAFILAYVFFNEVFAWNEGVGTVLVVTGLVFVTWGRMKENNMDNSANITNSENNNEKTGLLINAEAESKEWVVTAKVGANEKIETSI